MANNPSAMKRNRQSIKQRDTNRAERSRMRTAVKKLRETVEEGDGEKAQEMLPDTLRLIDATAQKKVIHRNAAARTKSRLERAVSKLKS